jgi:hypothetical protein
MAHLQNTPFDTRTTTEDWMTLLAYLQEQSGPAPNLKICTKPVTYTNGHVKQAYLDAAKGTPEYADYNNCHTVSTALKEYSARRGTVFLFIVNLDPAAEEKKQDDDQAENENQDDQQEERDPNWHALVVCIKNGDVGIYDPSYVANAATTQVHHLKQAYLDAAKDTPAFSDYIKGVQSETGNYVLIHC